MRFMFRAEISAAKGNEAIKSGALPRVIRKFMEDAKPEATYFIVLNGCRTMIAFVDFKSVEDLPRFGEPMFAEFDAKIEITPAMNAEELARGLGAVA